MKRHILGGIEHLSMSVWIKEHCHQNNFNGVEYSKFAKIYKSPSRIRTHETKFTNFILDFIVTIGSMSKNLDVSP